MSNFEEFCFGFVLVVDDEMPFNNLTLRHVNQFAPAFDVRKSGCCVPQESTPILVPRIHHQLVKSTRKVVVNAERDDFAHATPIKQLFIIIPRVLIISSN